MGKTCKWVEDVVAVLVYLGDQIKAAVAGGTAKMPGCNKLEPTCAGTAQVPCQRMRVYSFPEVIAMNTWSRSGSPGT
jgi:hypothetical protein